MYWTNFPNRQELVEHYESLMKDAKLREQRAEWRTRRLELSDARKQLLFTDREQLRQEMESFSENDKSPLLPQQHLPSNEEHVVVTHDAHPSTDHMISEPAHQLLVEEDKIVEYSEQSSTVAEEPHPLDEEPHPQSVEPLINPQNIVKKSITVSNENKHASELNVSVETENISKPHVSDSVVHQVLNPTSDIIAEEFSQQLSPRQQPRRGRVPVSTIKDIMYPSNSPTPVYHSTRGKPPPTTIQNLLHHHCYQQPGK